MPTMNPSERNNSSLSEYENLSDSDWLDIASSRASEDDDSIAGFEDSDREDIDGRPHSRHSFTSYSSSRDEVVDAWEGLIDESSDLETPLPLTERSELNSSLAADDDRPSSPLSEEDPEDERVKAALDQSMMSTLSSSRSNSLANSVQTTMVGSTRLRLSFPDPTTSRIESLNTSYEQLSHSEAEPPTQESAAVYADAITTEPAADPGSHPTPAVPEDNSREEDPITAASRVKPDLRIILYGASPMAKDTVVQMVLDKWALSTGLILAQTVVETPRVVSHIFNAQESKIWKSPLRSICVVDKTGLHQSDAFLESDCPSLAVVFLPSFSEISMFDHTLYLPVMTSSPLSLVDFLKTTDYLLEAEQQWENLGIPSHKLTSLSQFSSPVVDQEVLESASPTQMHHALRPLLPASVKKSTPQVSAYAISIMAVLSIVLGYIVHGCIDTHSSLHKLVVGYGSGRMLPTPHVFYHPAIDFNKSSPTSLLAVTSPVTALSASSSKDLAVAVFNSPSTLTAASSGPQPVASTSSPTLGSSHAAKDTPSECDCGCGLLTWPGKTDVMLRPTAPSSALSAYGNSPKSVSVISPHPHLHPVDTGKGKGKAKATTSDTSLYAFSTRIVTSISEYFDFDFACANKAVNKDIQDLMDALDQLLQVIARQTAQVWKQSQGTVSLLKGGLQRRNAHAKERARQMREYGAQWITVVGEHIKVRAEAANRNAKVIKEKLGNGKVDVKKASSQAWEKVLLGGRLGKLTRQEMRQERQQARLEKKMERQERRLIRKMRRALRAVERVGRV